MPRDCNEALILVHSYITKLRFPGPMRFTRNTGDDPADLPRAFTPPGTCTCAISVDTKGRNKGPILYTWESHEKNFKTLVNTCVPGFIPGLGGYLSIGGFQYTVLNPLTSELNLPPCFRPAIPADLDVVQCMLGEHHAASAPGLPRGSINGGRDDLPTATSGVTASGRNGAVGVIDAPAAGLGGPEAPGLVHLPGARISEELIVERNIQAGGPRAPAARTGPSTEVSETSAAGLNRQAASRSRCTPAAGMSEELALERSCAAEAIETPAVRRGLSAEMGGTLAAGSGGLAAPRLGRIAAAGTSERTTNEENIANNRRQQQLLPNSTERRPFKMVIQTRQGNGLWVDWDGSADWRNSHTYLRIGSANGASLFPDTPLPNMKSKGMYVKFGSQYKPVSGLWVYNGASWVSEQSLIKLTKKRKHMANADTPDVTLCLELADETGKRVGNAERDIINSGGWIVLRGPTAEQLGAERARYPGVASEQSSRRRQRPERLVTEDEAAGTEGLQRLNPSREDTRRKRITRATTARLIAGETLMQLKNTYNRSKRSRQIPIRPRSAGDP